MIHRNTRPMRSSTLIAPRRTGLLPAALNKMQGVEQLVDAALHGCCSDAQRGTVRTAVQSVADSLGSLSHSQHREVPCHTHPLVRTSLVCGQCTALKEPPKLQPQVRWGTAQADDTRAGALQEGLTQSMLECMTLHAEAGPAR